MSVRLSKTNSDGSKFSGTGSVTAVPAIHTGATGATGAAGADAAQPDWTFATPTEVAVGGTPTLGVTGTYPTQTFTFGVVTGATGVQGVQGDVGTAATIAAGTTTTGVAGSSAAVANSGSSSAATFDSMVLDG